MNTPEILYLLGSGALLLLGAVHNVIEWLGGRQATPPELQAVETAMKETRIKTPGREVPLFDFMKGFSFMMGFLFMAYGGLNLAVATHALTSPTAMLVNVLLCGIGLAVSLRYFFIVPTVFVSFAGVCYLGAWLVAAA